MISILAHYTLPKKHTPIIAVTGSILLFVLILIQNILFLGKKPLYIPINWLQVGQTQIDIGLYADDFARIFGLLVAFVSMLVVVFSVFYMEEDTQQRRYFVYLHAFTLAMLGLIWANSLILMYICWELVGLFSYFLISFWYHKKEAIQASRQAFWVNKLADSILLLGIFGLFLQTNTFQLSEILVFYQKIPNISDKHLHDIFWYALVIGAFAKSAQFPLQIWLPNAMTAPTPVSALLHASTMVTVGIYWLYRISPILPAHIQFFLVLVGFFTAFLGAFGAIFQKDIKKMLAYSTMSQLGYMVCAIGLAFEGGNAGIFHLFTHAFFKAGLFLGAGTIIYALHSLYIKNTNFDPQDMLQMGNLWRYMPYTAVCMTIFGGALIGLPLTSGFLSKEQILVHAWFWASQYEKQLFWVYFVPVGLQIVGFMTAFYVFRGLFLIFFSNNQKCGNTLENFIKNPENAHKIAEICKIDKYYFSIIPLFLLVIGSFGVFFGQFWGVFGTTKLWIFNFLNENQSNSKILVAFTAESAKNLHFLENLVLWISMISIFLALIFVYFSSKKSWFYTFQDKKYLNIEFLFANSWQYFLQTFKKLCQITFIFEQKNIDKFFVQSAKIYVVFSHIIAWFDRYVVDGFVHLGIALVRFLGIFFSNFQKGNAQNYVFWAFVFFLIIRWLF